MAPAPPSAPPPATAPPSAGPEFTPPVAAAPPVAGGEATKSAVAPDPHLLGAAVARLGNASRKSGRVALAVAAVTLELGEQVELVVQGRIQDSPGAAVLTDRRVLLVNEREWEPLVETLTIDGGLQVEGQADGRAAMLTITCPTAVWQIVDSRDVDLTKGFAARLRARAAGQ